MIAVVDYRAGNLTSVCVALEKLGHACRVTSIPEDIERAERVIFPGVGAAGTAMHHLTQLRLADALRQAVRQGKPFLGICLGYQVLFEHSEEDDTQCLGVLPGRVVRFPPDMPGDHGRTLKVPHMGWNQVSFRGPHPVWDAVPPSSEFYFVHSFYPVPAPEHVCAETTYGLPFAAGIARANLVAFQFHPEKSGRPGLALHDAFCTWTA